METEAKKQPLVMQIWVIVTSRATFKYFKEEDESSVNFYFLFRFFAIFKKACKDSKRMAWFLFPVACKFLYNEIFNIETKCGDQYINVVCTTNLLHATSFLILTNNNNKLIIVLNIAGLPDVTFNKLYIKHANSTVQFKNES
jgi:hypothetical protein